MLTLKGFVTQTLNMRTKFKRVLFVFLGGFFTHIQIVLERFVINSYLRARLQKIESQIWHYTGPGDAGSRMTQVHRGDPSYILHDSRPSLQEEAAFAVSFRETGDSLLNTLVLKHLPGTWDPGIFSYPLTRHGCSHTFSCLQRSQSQSFQDPGSVRQSLSKCWRAGRGLR